LKLRAPGHQFGGRDSWRISRCPSGIDPVGRWSLRGQTRRPPGLREVKARPTRDCGWGRAVATKPERV